MTDLEPCPFCGSEEVETFCNWSRWNAQCYSCKATGPEAPTEVDATDKWNRASPYKPQQCAECGEEDGHDRSCPYIAGCGHP